MISFFKKVWNLSNVTFFVGFFLILAGTLSAVIRLSQSDFSYSLPRDYRIIYAAAKLNNEGGNPYNINDVQVTWKKICEREDLDYNIDIVMKMGLQYSPNTLLLFKPLTFLTFKQSVIVWYSLSFFSLVILAFFITSFLKLCHINHPLLLPIVIVALFAYKGTTFAFLMGNPLFISSACGFAALNNINKARGWLSGLLMVLCSLKVSMLFPFFFLIMVLHGKRKVIPSIISIMFFAFLSILLFYRLIPYYLSSLSVLDYHIYENFKPVHGEHSLISLNIDLKALLFAISDKIVWLKWPVMFLLIFYGWLNRQKLKVDGINLFIFIYLFLCMMFYHSYGDISVVFPLIVILYLRTSNIFRILLIIPAITFLIPINGILVRLNGIQYPLLFEVNLSASVLLCTIIAVFSLNHNASIKPVIQVQ